MQYTSPYNRTGIFRPRVGSPLVSIDDEVERKMRLRAERCYNEKDSNEAKVFNAVFYSAIVRKEYANEKLRNALALLQAEKKLFRHTIKQRSNSIFRSLAQWDKDIARVILSTSERALDFYDDLTAYAITQIDKYFTPFYYSILQVLTKHGCRYKVEMANLETAVALQEFAERQLLQDVGRFYKTAPQLQQLGTLLDTPMLRTAEALRAELSVISSKGCKDDINLNADTNVTLAADTLFRNLSSADNINRIVDAVLAPNAEEIEKEFNKFEQQRHEQSQNP